MEMEATGAPQNHYHTLNQQVGSITLITRRVIQRANINLAFVGIIYTALFALYAMLFWLAFF